MRRIGLIGSGFIAGIHAERVSAIPGATVTAVYSPDDPAAFVDDYGLEASAYDTPKSFFADADVDVVDVCSPTDTHRRYVERAADAGLDVFCEKPLAVTLEDATSMIEATERAGVQLLVGHVLRYFPAYERVQSLVAAGEIGTVGTIRARRHSPFPAWGSDSWFGDDDRSGGVFVDLGIHEFDFLRWCVGPVERVFARRRRWEDRQYGHATLRFTSGAVGYVEAGWDRPTGAGLTSDLEVAGDAGILEYDSTASESLSLELEGKEPPAVPTVEGDGYHRELASFVRALDGEVEPRVTADDALEALRIAVAASRSAESGKPVDVEAVT